MRVTSTFESTAAFHTVHLIPCVPAGNGITGISDSLRSTFVFSVSASTLLPFPVLTVSFLALLPVRVLRLPRHPRDETEAAAWSQAVDHALLGPSYKSLRAVAGMRSARPLAVFLCCLPSCPGISFRSRSRSLSPLPHL